MIPQVVVDIPREMLVKLSKLQRVSMRDSIPIGTESEWTEVAYNPISPSASDSDIEKTAGQIVSQMAEAISELSPDEIIYPLVLEAGPLSWVVVTHVRNSKKA